MPFFQYRQNNSGGSFDILPDAGISIYVIVEASDAEHADRIAEGIGLYFDGFGDCPCCGDRWYPAHSSWGSDGGDDVPMIYDTPVGLYNFNSSIRWAGDDPQAYVHYLNGSVFPYGGKVSK